jgi:hypothetical protein
MARILLATEGESEEVVAVHILGHLWPGALVDPKKYTTRGFPVVRRSVPLLAKAAYYGHYDLLVVHFDLDDTLEMTDDTTVSESVRWQDIYNRIHTTLNSLPFVGRAKAVRVALMAPCQSTDAWLTWAIAAGDGRKWEKKNRLKLKTDIFGTPPMGIIKKSETIAPFLIKRMIEEPIWPISLRAFEDQVKAAIT